MSDDNDLDPCIACADTNAKTINAGGFGSFHQDCPRCGEFKLSGTVLAMMSSGVGKEKRAKLSGWIRDQNRAGAIPMITSDIFTKIIARPLPTVAERATNLLLEAAQGQASLGERFNTNDPRFLAATYSHSNDEIHFLMRLLSEQGLAEHKAMGGQAEILPHGYIEIDALTRKSSSSKQGFVAMWFDQGLDAAYTDGFQLGILNAGYDPVRIDRVEHVNRIDDEIIAQIKASRFVVADFTGHSDGVYFEAGFALGLDMPVIWTCRKDHMDKLHFDIRQFNCIDWNTPEEIAERLQQRLEAVLGAGPGKS